MMRGNESDCICAKPNGEHEEYCDAYRLSEFLKKCASVKVIDNVKDTRDVLRHTKVCGF